MKEEYETAEKLCKMSKYKRNKNHKCAFDKKPVFRVYDEVRHNRECAAKEG